MCQGRTEDGRLCGVVSPEFSDLEAMCGWSCVHTMRYPNHTSFRMVADVPMVLVPQ
ncbi:DUF7848 domain-containing protein [Kitasatospora cineracea]